MGLRTARTPRRINGTEAVGASGGGMGALLSGIRSFWSGRRVPPLGVRDPGTGHLSPAHQLAQAQPDANVDSVRCGAGGTLASADVRRRAPGSRALSLSPLGVRTSLPRGGRVVSRPAAATAPLLPLLHADFAPGASVPLTVAAWAILGGTLALCIAWMTAAAVMHWRSQRRRDLCWNSTRTRAGRRRHPQHPAFDELAGPQR